MGKEDTMMRHFRALALGIAIAAAAAPAFAHSVLKNSAPASGSVIPASPAEITLNFNEEASMTSMVVVEAGKPERKLEFMPTNHALNRDDRFRLRERARCLFRQKYTA
jgi:methionine-rich copper-binding protein CopC